MNLKFIVTRKEVNWTVKTRGKAHEKYKRMNEQTKSDRLIYRPNNERTDKRIHPSIQPSDSNYLKFELKALTCL